MHKAIFFDKDGVLNKDVHPFSNVTNPVFFEKAAEMIAFVRNQGFMTIVVTNQTVVSRGLLKERKLIKLLFAYEKKFKTLNENAVFEGIYYCPHHPNASIKKYRVICDCRKPKPGMISRACNDYDINPANSYFIGDRFSDIIAGHLAGCTTIHCKTGMHHEQIIETDLKFPENIAPDFVIDDITQLRDILT